MQKIFKKDASQVTVSVVSVAAQDLRLGRRYNKPFDPILLKEKVRAMLSVCEEHNHDAVVLGAFGCGAYEHDPKKVAKVFQELLTQEFRVFRVAIFAILYKGSTYDEFARKFPNLRGNLKEALVQVRAEYPTD